MDNCALDRDNSVVKATAINSGLRNETTAQNFFYINCLENRTRPQRKVNYKWIAALKKRDISVVKATENFPDFTTRPQHRAF